MREQELTCPNCGMNLFEDKKIFMIIDGKKIPYKTVTSCFKCKEVIITKGADDFDAD